MPIVRIKKTFECKICGAGYRTRPEAVRCEKSGIAIPEFNRFDVVELQGLPPGIVIRLLSGGFFRTKKDSSSIRCIVKDIYEEDGTRNPHNPPSYYVVSVIKGVSRQKKILGLTVFCKKDLKLVKSSEEKCPLCFGKTILVQNDDYVPFWCIKGITSLFLGKTVGHYKCLSCGSEFFTKEQSDRVRAEIEKRRRC